MNDNIKIPILISNKLNTSLLSPKVESNFDTTKRLRHQLRHQVKHNVTDYVTKTKKLPMKRSILIQEEKRILSKSILNK